MFRASFVFCTVLAKIRLRFFLEQISIKRETMSVGDNVGTCPGACPQRRMPLKRIIEFKIE
jgi:hypothetical protein